MTPKRLSAIEMAVYGRDKTLPNTHPPEPEFPQTADEWDDMVFSKASYFTVVTGTNPFNRNKREFKSLPDAIDAALQAIATTLGPKPMVYAVTAEGRHTMLVQKKWDRYLEEWNRKSSTGS